MALLVSSSESVARARRRHAHALLGRINATAELAKRQAGRAKKHADERIRIEPFLRMQRAARDGRIDNVNLSKSKGKSQGMSAAPDVAVAQAEPAQARTPAWAC